MENQSTPLNLAVAAKGHCDPELFFNALTENGLAENKDVSIHIAHDQPWDITNLPSNIFLHYCKPSTSILQLWGVAIEYCTGEYVAVLDIKCPPKKNWSLRVFQEIHKQTPVFFGVVEPGWRHNDPQILGYLTEYAQFNKPLPVNGKEVPGNNVVFKKDLIADRSDMNIKGFFKTFMIWQLEKEQGIKAIGFNDMSVSYFKPFAYKHYMLRRYEQGRCFAACRHENANQPPRWACLFFSVLLPFLRIWRIYKVVKSNTEIKKSFFRFSFLICQSEIAWSIGEFLGYGFGGKDNYSRLD